MPGFCSKYRVTSNNLYTGMLRPGKYEQARNRVSSRGEWPFAPTWLSGKDGLKKPSFWGWGKGAIALSLPAKKKPGFYEHFGGVTKMV